MDRMLFMVARCRAQVRFLTALKALAPQIQERRYSKARWCAAMVIDRGYAMLAASCPAAKLFLCRCAGAQVCDWASHDGVNLPG